MKYFISHREILKKKQDIESIFIIYSGHGLTDKLLLPQEDCVHVNDICENESIFHAIGKYALSKRNLSFSRLDQIFDSENLREHKEIPKLFLFDCCRGGNSDVYIPNSRTKVVKFNVNNYNQSIFCTCLYFVSV